MRTKKSLLNAISGFISISVTILFSFVTRMIFVRYLNQEYLGYNALFSNIISVMSVAELGIGEVIAFSLFEPIHQNDYKKVASIMKLFQKVYIAIGIFIAIGSIVLSYYIYFFMSVYPQNLIEVRFLFILYATATVSSYFFSYQRTLFYATQNNYCVNIIDCIFKIVLNLGQIIGLIITKNYVIYLFIMIISTFINNLVIYYYGKIKLSKYVTQVEKLSSSEVSEIFSQIKSLGITRICSIGINSTDNIFISRLTNMATLGVYSNYSLIVGSLQTLLVSTLNGVKASIGDLVISGNKRKIYEIFELNSFVHYIAASLCTICVICLINDFVLLMFGETYLLGTTTILICTFNMYLYVIQQPIWHLISVSGLFSQYKNINIFQLIMNIVLSICFGYFFGLDGIIGATTICYIVSMIFATRVIYNEIFTDYNIISYYTRQLFLFILTFMCTIISKLIVFFIYQGDNLYFILFVTAIISITVFIIINYVIFDCIGLFGKKYFRIIFIQFTKRNNI